MFSGGSNSGKAGSISDTNNKGKVYNSGDIDNVGAYGGSGFDNDSGYGYNGDACGNDDYGDA